MSYFPSHNKFSESMSTIKSVEAKFTELVKNGSKEPANICDMVYYSGIHNSYLLLMKVIKGEIGSEVEYDKLFNDMMHFTKPS